MVHQIIDVHNNFWLHLFLFIALIRDYGLGLTETLESLEHYFIVSMDHQVSDFVMVVVN